MLNIYYSIFIIHYDINIQYLFVLIDNFLGAVILFPRPVIYKCSISCSLSLVRAVASFPGAKLFEDPPISSGEEGKDCLIDFAFLSTSQSTEAFNPDYFVFKSESFLNQLPVVTDESYITPKYKNTCK